MSASLRLGIVSFLCFPLCGCAVLVDRLEGESLRPGPRDARRLSYAIEYRSPSNPSSWFSKKARATAHETTRRILADNGIEPSATGASEAADLAIVIEEFGVPETAWDWLCGLSLGLIPAYKDYIRMKFRFTDARTGNSRMYAVREHLFAHLFLAPLSLAQGVYLIAGPQGPDRSEYRKALEDFLARNP